MQDEDDLAVVAAIVADTQRFTETLVETHQDVSSGPVARAHGASHAVTLGMREVARSIALAASSQITAGVVPSTAGTDAAVSALSAGPQPSIVDECEIDLDDAGYPVEAATFPQDVNAVVRMRSESSGSSDTSTSDAVDAVDASSASSTSDEADTAHQEAHVSEGVAGAVDGEATGTASGARRRKQGTHPAAGADVDDGAADEEQDVPAAGILKSQHEVPLSVLPLPSLECLVAPSASPVTLAGELLHVYHTAGAARSQGGKARGHAAAQTTDASGLKDASCKVLTIVVQACAGSRPLNEGSHVCLRDRRILGVVEEVFGPVASPMYLLRVRGRDSVDDEEIAAHGVAADVARDATRRVAPEETVKVEASTSSLSLLAAEYADSDESEHGPAAETLASSAPTITPVAVAARAETLVRVSELRPGLAIFAVSSLCKYIFPDSILASNPKGSDASNVYDEEVGDEEREFSDDEAEANARAAAKSSRMHGSTATSDLRVAQASIDGSNIMSAAGKRTRERERAPGPPAAPYGPPRGSTQRAGALLPSHPGMHAAVQPVSPMPGQPWQPPVGAWPPAGGPALPHGLPAPTPEAYAALMQYHMQLQLAWQAHYAAAMPRGPPS